MSSRSSIDGGGWSFAEIIDWCRGRSWLARLPVLLFLAYTGWEQYQRPDQGTFFSAINLCIHEGGHLILRPLGNDLLHVAGGTLAQIVAPVIAMVILGRQRDYFGIAFALGWLSTNLVEIGVYMADARAQELPLVTAEGGNGEGTIHDWNYLFGRFNLLADDVRIGTATRDAAAAIMIIAVIFGAVLLALMAMPPKAKKPAPEERPHRPLPMLPRRY